MPLKEVKRVRVANFSEQPRETAMCAALRINKRDAGGDPHFNRDARQTRQQRRHRADAAGPRVDRRLARAQRYAEPYAPLLLPANNVARQQCAQNFIEIKGTHVIIRKVIGTMHDKRERHAGTDIILQDLVWILAPISSRGYESQI